VQIVKTDASFGRRAATALGLAIVADSLDYFLAPLFSSPIVGDIFDSIVTSMLYSITRSKLSTAINMVEFIPFVGDLIPVYTLSTLLWISKELGKPQRPTYNHRPDYRETMRDRNFMGLVRQRLRRGIA
jgi:hypothetical protein